MKIIWQNPPGKMRRNCCNASWKPMETTGKPGELRQLHCRAAWGRKKPAPMACSRMKACRWCSLRWQRRWRRVRATSGPIISLRREDAERLGYNTAGLDAAAPLSAQPDCPADKIAPENFRWYAAFHNAGHHPHVHMMAYSIDPKEAYLTAQGIAEIKSGLARRFFART